MAGGETAGDGMAGDGTACDGMSGRWNDEGVMLKKLRRTIGNIIHPKAVVGKVDHACPMERHGSDYGGWTINPTGLGKDSIVYSFGIGEDVSFDVAMIRRFGCVVHAFDPTPRSIEWVKARQKSGEIPSGFVLHEYGLAAHDGTVSFFAPDNPTHVSHTMIEGATKGRQITVPVKRLATILRELGHARVDLLKMDIEGAEYAAVEDILKERVAIPQMLVEYHHRFPNVGAARTQASINLLGAHGYRLFHISESAEEYSFVKV